MKTETNKSNIFTSLIWKFMERSGVHGIQFFVQIILARLLLPKDYGIIALAVVFTTIAGAFVQSGLNTALIQRKNADEIDFSSVFCLSLFIACLLYLVLFIVAPYIAVFYGMSQITSVFRILSVTLIFGVFNSIQNAVVARNLQFKKLFFSSMGAVLGSGAVGIYMAYVGLGIWALVGQQISNHILVTLILWFTVEWRPQFIFSFKRVRKLYSFGWKLLVSSLIDTIYGDLYSLVVGKIYNPVMLGFYNRGQQFPSLIVSNIDGSIQSVMLPVLASQQDNKFRVKNMMRRAVVTSSFVVFPTMVGLAVIAEPLVKIVLTEKWLPCVPFLQIFCAVYVLWPIHTANLQAVNALGRSDIFLKLEITKKIIGISILMMTMPYGIYAITLGAVLNGLIGSFINVYPNKHLLNYSYKEQWNDIMPSLILSLVMGIAIYGLKWLELSVLATLIIQVCAGTVIYIGMAWMFKLECFSYLFAIVKRLFTVQEIVEVRI